MRGIGVGQLCDNAPHDHDLRSFGCDADAPPPEGELEWSQAAERREIPQTSSCPEKPGPGIAARADLYPRDS